MYLLVAYEQSATTIVQYFNIWIYIEHRLHPSISNIITKPISSLTKLESVLRIPSQISLWLLEPVSGEVLYEKEERNTSNRQTGIPL